MLSPGQVYFCIRALVISGGGAVCGTVVNSASWASSSQDTGIGPMRRRQNPPCTGAGLLESLLSKTCLAISDYLPMSLDGTRCLPRASLGFTAPVLSFPGLSALLDTVTSFGVAFNLSS